MKTTHRSTKVLVTGAGGFIGSHLGKFLKAKGTGFAAWTSKSRLT